MCVLRYPHPIRTGPHEEIHSDEARLVRNFVHVSLWVGTGHPMFKEPVRSNWAAVSL